MSSTLLDANEVISSNDQWTKLEEIWGNPVDLDTEEDPLPSKLKPVFSSLDLRKSTFDSSFIFKTVERDQRQFKRHLSRHSVLGYSDFLQDLQQHDVREQMPRKQSYLVGGEVLSAVLVEQICSKIDDTFKSVEKLCTATSTIPKKRDINEVIQCSISYEDLSFDDTVDTEIEKDESDDLDNYIEEAFEHLSSTLVSIANDNGVIDEMTKHSVTTLVKKFGAILDGPVNGGPRRRKLCDGRFKELAEFWRSRTCDTDK